MQAFGALVRKATTAREAHSYPLASVPLALSTEESSVTLVTNTVQKSTLNGQTSKLIFGNNVSLKTLTILTQRNVDG